MSEHDEKRKMESHDSQTDMLVWKANSLVQHTVNYQSCGAMAFSSPSFTSLDLDFFCAFFKDEKLLLENTYS